MATDKILMRELKSLQEELSTSQRERHEKVVAPTAPDTGAPATAVGMTAPPAPPAPTGVPAEDQGQRVELNDLLDEIKEFFETAEKNIAAHPTTSVLAAMLLGILIGRTLGGRS